MNLDQILAELQAATTPEAKAALVAESVIADLPLKVETAARRCGLLLWFTPKIITALLADETEEESAEAVKIITGLPFVEKVPWGYTYHNSTRQGMLEKYSREQPDEIIAAWMAAVPVLLDDWDNDEAAVAALYGLAVTGQKEEVRRQLDELLHRFREREDWSRLLGAFEVLDEVERFSLPTVLQLTEADWIAIGIAHLAQGEWDRVILCSDQALRLNPDSFAALSIRGMVRSLQDELEQAIADYDHALEIKPLASTLSLRASVYYRKGESRRALTDYTRAIELDPECASAYSGRGAIYARQEMPDLAISDLTQAIRIDPEDVSSYFSRGYAYFQQGQLDRAINDYTLGLEYSKRQNDSLQQGQLDRAILDRIQSIQSDFYTAYPFVMRGLMYQASHEFDQAIVDFRQAIELDPQNANVYGAIAVAYYMKEEVGEAIEAYQKAIQLAPQNTRYYKGLAFAARDHRQFDLAITACRKILEIEPDNAHAHNNLGYLYIHEGKLSDARSHLEQSLALDPQWAYAMLNLGIVEWRSGQIEAAHLLFQKALSVISDEDKSDPATRGWLQVAVSDTETGLVRIQSYLADKPNMGDLYNLWDWTNAVLLRDAEPPAGMQEIIRMVDEILHLSGS